MTSPGKRRCGGCPHCAELWGSRRALSQLQRSLLAHFQERKAADEPLMPLGEGAMCLACSVQSDTPQTHPEAGHLGCPGPPILLDLRTGELYCTACADYVFDRGFDLALQSALAAAKNGGSRGASGASGADAAGSEATAADGAPPRGGAAPEALPTAELARALVDGGFRPLAADGFPAGLRGLNNLGNTCFMNSVLQAILHAPLLGNHYLLNRHSKAGCAITADGGYCVNCELDGVFSAAYSGRRSGYSPAQFLHTWWMLAGGGLAGYQQQDAHEFFCFVLEMMAATAGPDNITQRVFGGTLRSDLVCACCGHVSTSHEQFSHLSLDIPPPQQLIAPTILPRPTGGAGGSQATAAAAAAATPAAAAAAAKAASAPAPRSHKKGASGSKADGKAKLVGAAKLSHERALARKAAEAAAAAAAAAGQAAASDVQSMLEGVGSQPMPGLVPRVQGAPPPALQQRAQQNGGGADNSSEGDAADLCASDSMSLGASVGAGGGMLGQSGLEAASGIGAHGSVLGMGGDDAQDTLCSPRHRLNGGAGLAPAPGGTTAGQPPSWWPKQQQQQQVGRPAAAPPGRPPIPPGMRSGRGGPATAVGVAKQAGGRQGAAVGFAPDPQQHQQQQQQQQAGRQDDSGSPDLETTGMQIEVSGISLSALEPSVAPPALPLAGAAGLPLALGSAQQQQQDALAAATNLPGTQDAAAAAAGAAAAALPPQLAGYYRWPGASLLGCLNRFTHAEQLGAGERWTCERCLSSAHAVKQLSLRHLPPLLVFHAKRFEHAGGLRAVAKKLDTYLSFPLSDLDMRPYLASAVLRSRFRLPPPPPAPALAAKARRASTGQLAQPQHDGQQQQQQQRSPASEGGVRRSRSGAPPGGAGEAGGADEASETANGLSLDPGQYLYDLYAVVCHRGSFQGGHYVAYVRAADRRWYLCDDAWVTASDEEAVRNCQAYMLFYAQKQLLEGR